MSSPVQGSTLRNIVATRYVAPTVNTKNDTGSAKPKASAILVGYKRVALGAMASLALLSVQVIAGVWIQLYDHIERVHPGYLDSNYLGASLHISTWILGSGLVALSLHLVSGVVLGIVSLLITIWVGKTRDRFLAILSVVCLVFIISAGLFGLGYLDNFQTAASFEMAIAFALAVLGYSFMLSYAMKRSEI